MERFDAAVIGGGLLGCFAARSLCRWKLGIVLLDAREDVCTGISRANTALIYPGYDHKPGTLKAAMTVRANAAFGALCRELDVPFSRCGSLMLSGGDRADAVLQAKLVQGRENGVPGLRLLERAEIDTMEPDLPPAIRRALWAPTAGTVNPWQLGIAACENAVKNGVRLFLNSRVLSICATDGGYVIGTPRGEIFARAVINCAGLSADRVQALIYPPTVCIVPNAGDYLIFDRFGSSLPRHILQFEPEDGGKGLTAVPTTEGSLLLGPTEREYRADYATSAEGLAELYSLAERWLPGLKAESVIRSFAALRPNPQRPDGGSIGSFVIERPAARFLSMIGIKTPGLTCAQELGSFAAEAIAAALGAEDNPAFDPVRRGIVRAHGLDYAARRTLIAAEPDYGEIVCFCEDVTKAEVLEAIRRGAVTVDGIKRRVGTGMGRCQGARCQQKLASLLAEALGVPVSAVKKDGPGSEIVGDADGSL